jgi:hypothetical protein
LREYFELQRWNLRGRRPVRADRRLRADEKRIRTQSAIFDKTPRSPPAVCDSISDAVCT